jgi:D-alanine-D-alanine ligase
MISKNEFSFSPPNDRSSFVCLFFYYERQAAVAMSEKDSKAASEKDKPGPRGKNGKSLPPSLGPVKNLEEHVRSDWWRNLFNSLYLKTDADVVDDQDITRQEIDVVIDALKPAMGDRILDLCCGQGRHSLEMARRGFHKVEGLDRSHYLIQRGKSQARKEGLPVKFREGDARKLPFPTDAFDVVAILGNSFGYFDTVEDDLRVLKEVCRVLKPWGKLLIDVTDGDYVRSNYQARSWEWIDKKHFVCRERSLSADQQRLISREVINNVEEGVLADQFYAERLYTPETLGTLMKEAGFTEPTVHSSFSPNSQRNQDLGMMERRIVISSVARKEWTTLKRKIKKTLKNVVVLMGDPSRPDRLKPSSVFDDDDFYTIDQLKDALRGLPGYQFSYLNSHGSLIQDLTKLQGKVDYIFNLCDEGFANDPRKELHVPALLEMLDIPYTGGAPQCLAYCYDKSLVRGISNEMGIPVPEACFINPEDTTFELPIGFPVIVKPNFGDSSFGITQRCVAYNPEDLLNAISEIREKFGYDKPILCEEFLTGKDLSLGIIGNPSSGYHVLPITEEDYSAVPEHLPRLCGYEAKWEPDSPYWKIKSIPAELTDEQEKTIIDCSLKLFQRLECRDYARVDWRLSADGNPKLLEVNPNPGWCWDGHLCKMAKFGGMTYADMLEDILKATEQRLDLRSVCHKKEEDLDIKQLMLPPEQRKAASVPA